MMIKKYFCFFIFFCVLFCSYGCQSSKENINDIFSNTDITLSIDDTNNQFSNGIDINIENYQKFLTVNCESKYDEEGWSSASLSISGVLDFAYYENVVVTTICTFNTQGITPIIFTSEKIIELNTTGDGYTSQDETVPDNITPAYSGYSMRYYHMSFSVVDITGKVYLVR